MILNLRMLLLKRD